MLVADAGLEVAFSPVDEVWLCIDVEKHAMPRNLVLIYATSALAQLARIIMWPGNIYIYILCMDIE